MRVLIVEDNAFNAYCLTRLLQTEYPAVQINVANDSVSALQAIVQETFSIVILDGDLGASHGNGPALADLFWQYDPSLAIIAWSDCEKMRQAFADIFMQHGKNFTDIYCWPKIVSAERIRYSFNYLMQQFAIQVPKHPAAICA